MAISSRSLLLNLSLGTILLCFFFLVASANSDYDDIHAVKHCSPTADGKAGEHPNKGDQCREENDDVDDDFDDTYKIVNNVAVTLSASGRILQQTNTNTNTEVEDDLDLEDNPASEEVLGSLFVMGH